MALKNFDARHVGAYGTSNPKQIWEPQRVAHGQLRIVGLSGDSGDIITLSLASFALPKVSVNPLQVGYINEFRKFAGRPQFDNLPIRVRDYVDSGTARSLLAWYYQVYNPETGVSGLKSQYAKGAYITLAAPNNDDKFERVYDLQGVWPLNYDPGEINMDGDELLEINLTLAIDKWTGGTNLNPTVA